MIQIRFAGEEHPRIKNETNNTNKVFVCVYVAQSPVWLTEGHVAVLHLATLHVREFEVT